MYNILRFLALFKGYTVKISKHMLCLCQANLLILLLVSAFKTTMRKLFYFLLIYILFSFQAYCQKYANNWYFGNLAGINFSGPLPVALTNSTMITDEGSASISDAGGNLLIYTDGVTVFNRNGAIMPNGTGLKGHFSSTQSALIVPKPGSPDRYFLFTADAGEYVDIPNDGIHFSEIDMTLNGGLGDIIPSTKNTTLLATDATEKLCAVKHGNGNDVWIIVHGWNNNTFYAYLVNSNGVNTTPVISQSGSVHSGNADNSIGQMKCSPQGNKLALAVRISGFFELFDFDNTTGVLSNPLTLQIPQFISAYGVEFSPDGSRLYVSTADFHTLYQYNLLAGSPTAIINSLLSIANLSATYGGSMQLAPDGKIYIALNSGLSGGPYLGKINLPNVLGTGCNYTNSGVYLGGGTCFFGLPNFISNYLLPTTMNENNFKNYVDVYYDEQSKSLKINFESDNLENTKVKLMDITGKEITSATLKNKNTEVFLPLIKTGIYILELSNNVTIFNKRINIW